MKREAKTALWITFGLFFGLMLIKICTLTTALNSIL